MQFVKPQLRMLKLDNEELFNLAISVENFFAYPIVSKL